MMLDNVRTQTKLNGVSHELKYNVYFLENLNYTIEEKTFQLIFIARRAKVIKWIKRKGGKSQSFKLMAWEGLG